MNITALSPQKMQQTGFSLLEVLVAFSILALSMGTLMQIFSGGLRNVGLSEDYARAVAIAEEQLTTVGIETPVVPGETRGEFGEKFRWQMLAKPLDGTFGLEQSPTTTVAVSPVGLMGLVVTVEWDDAANRRILTLNSARLFVKKP